MIENMHRPIKILDMVTYKLWLISDEINGCADWFKGYIFVVIWSTLTPYKIRNVEVK